MIHFLRFDLKSYFLFTKSQSQTTLSTQIKINTITTPNESPRGKQVGKDFFISQIKILIFIYFFPKSIK
jgi:hypothetical protein